MEYDTGSVESKSKVSDSDGISEFDYLEELLEEDNHVTLKNYLATHDVSRNEADDIGRNLLHLACLHAAEYCTKALIEAGWDVNGRCTGRYTPLHYAACSDGDSGACVALLLRAGAKINLRTKSWQTPLMFAAQYSNYYICTQLVTAGAKLHLRDRFGRDALDIAKFQLEGCIRNKDSRSQRQEIRQIISYLELFWGSARD